MASKLISAQSISNDPEDPALEESTTDNQQFHGLNALQNTRKPPCAETQLRPVGAHSISHDVHRTHRQTFSVTGDCCRKLYSSGPQNGATLSTTTGRLLARVAPLARSISEAFARLSTTTTDWQSSRQPSRPPGHSLVHALALARALLSCLALDWCKPGLRAQLSGCLVTHWCRLAYELLLSAAWHSLVPPGLRALALGCLALSGASATALKTRRHMILNGASVELRRSEQH